MSRLTCDVVVIGGGIVGAACADAFAREGFSTALIESQVIGGGATAAGMGHIALLDDSDTQFDLTQFSRDLWRDLVDHLPPSCEVQRCGALWVAADEQEMDTVGQKAERYHRGGVRVEVLDARQLAEAEPHLRTGLPGALLVAEDMVVYSPCVAQWLTNRACQRGAKVLLGDSVRKITDGAVWLDDGSQVSADWVIVASGCAATQLVPGIPLKPRKGHLAITERRPGFVRHQLIELGYMKSAHATQSDSVAFNIQPRFTGQLLIGSSRQFDDLSADVRPDMLGRMLRRSLKYLPQLSKLRITRTWCGFRAVTPDKLPLIGPSVSNERVLLATGHEGLGITTSLATAELLVDQVMQRKSKIAREAFDPSRFAMGAKIG